MAEVAGMEAGRVDVRTFVQRRAETPEAVSELDTESQAALRQFSLERCTGYGVDYADAVELRSRVLAGQSWQEAATEVAEQCLARIGAAGSDGTDRTRVMYLRRASALLRMSQVMMLSDTDERRAIFASSAELYAQAASIAGDRERVEVETAEGTLAGWFVPAGEGAVGAAIVVGGVEGWAMDFDCMGEALAARGVDAYLFDGPGQGETRMQYGVYLTPTWLGAYRAMVDEIERRSPHRPIAVVGNSMGGSFALGLAAADTRIVACCDNGGISVPGLVPPSIGTFFTKMTAFCAAPDAAETSRIWSSVDPTATGPNAGYPLLIVHGGEDPLVSDGLLQMLIESVPTDDRQLVVFSDGVHCIYNHLQDRDAVISDWIRASLATEREGDDGDR